MKDRRFQILLIIFIVGVIAAVASVFFDFSDTPNKLADSDRKSKQVRKSPRDSSESQTPESSELPEGVTIRQDFVSATKEQKRQMARESKSPNHLDEGMEWGYYDQDGNWVAVSGPGRLASDGYFYDSQGRRIYARKSGFYRAAKDGVESSDDEEVSDENLDAIYVHVQDSSHEAIPNVKVTILESETTLLEGTTNELGTIKFPPLTEGGEREVEVRAEKANYKTFMGSEQTLAPNRGKRIDLFMTLDWSISGTVFDSQELPLEGVRVALGDVDTSLTTEVDGAFRFAGLSGRQYDLALHKQGYQSEYIHKHTIPGHDLRIIMKRAVYVSGQVKDQDGNPVEHVRVEAKHAPELQEEFIATTFTDAQGMYRVDAVEGAERMYVNFARAGYRPQTKHPIRAETSDLNITLEKTDEATVSGILQFADGTYPKSSVTAIGNRTNSNSYANSEPHRFEVSFVPKEGQTAKLLIYSTEFKRQEIDVGALAKGEHKDLGKIVVEPDDKLRGTVVTLLPDGSEKPLPNAQVILISSRSFSVDETGRFEIDIDKLGDDRELLVHAEGYVGIAHKFQLPSPNELKIALRLVETGYCAVQLLDKDSHSYVVGMNLGGGFLRETPLPTDDDGITSLSVEAREGIRIEVRLELSEDGPIYRIAGDSFVEVFASEEEARENLTTIQVEPAARVRVELLEGATAVNEDTLVHFVPTNGQDAHHRHVSTQNQWIQENELKDVLALGTYEVSCDELRILPRPFEITESKAYTYEINPTATIKVSGTIRNANGQPHANRGFYLFRSKGSGVFETGFTDSQGRYEIENLWPGDFHLAIAKDNAEQAAQYFEKITVSSGKQDQTHDIQLPEASTTIKGVVKYSDGTPVAGATVSMTDRSVTMARGVLAGYVRTDSDGKFIAKHIESHANIDIRVGGYIDNAETRLTFHRVTTGASGTTLEVEIIVEKKGASGKVGYQAAEGVIFKPRDVTAIAIDSQGRRIGNFFGGNFRDLAPGTYTYQFYSAGYIATPVTITVSESLQVSVSGKATWSYDPDWPSPEG